MSGTTSPAYATVVLDVDSTVSGVEGIDWLAGLRGAAVAKEIAELTNSAMLGVLPLEAVYGARLDAIRPTRDEVAALGRLYVDRIAPGCREAIAALRAAGVRIVLVSGGIRQAMVELASHLGVDPSDVHAVRLEFDERGAYDGFDSRSPLTTANGKRRVIESLKCERPILMVGDGATDLAARDAVDQFAAFTGFVTRDTVVQEADIVFANFAAITAAILELR